MSDAIAFNKLFFGFPVSMEPPKKEDVKNEDMEKYEMLSMSSGLTKVFLPTHYGMRYVNFTGTTNEEAMIKLLTVYKNPLHLAACGDHIYFEGFFPNKNGTFVAFFGS